MQKPLAGKTVIVTRSAEDFDACAVKIRELGGAAVACPVIAFQLPENTAQLDQGIRFMGHFDWIVFTSANSVRFFWMRMKANGCGVESLQNVQCAVIGPATAGALRVQGVEPAFVAKQSNAAEFFEEFRQKVAIEGKKFLVPRSQIAHRTIIDLLRKHGGKVSDVTAYCTVPVGVLPPDVPALIEAGRADWFFFTSSSTVDHFLALLPDGLKTKIRAASIGPSTSATLRGHGIEPVIEATSHSMDGLIEAVVRAVNPE